MSHAVDDDHSQIEHHNPEEGFDRGEPNSHAIWAFSVGSVAVLILLIVAVQVYFEDIYQKAVYQRVLSQPSESLQDVRNRDAWNLTHYMYRDLDKSSKNVRIPIDKAMQMLADEAAAGKTFYPGKATVPKKEEPEAAAAPAAAPATK